MEKYQRAQETEQGRSLLEEGLEDKRQLEEMESQDDVDEYISNFYHDAEDASFMRRFQLVQDMLDFMKSHPESDHELQLIVPKLYRHFFTAIAYKRSRYEDGGEESFQEKQDTSLGETWENYMELYAMTGIGPDTSHDYRNILNNPLLVQFENITNSSKYYEQNASFLIGRLKKPITKVDLVRYALSSLPESGWPENSPEKTEATMKKIYADILEDYLSAGYYAEELHALEVFKKASGVSVIITKELKERLQQKCEILTSEMTNQLVPEMQRYFYHEANASYSIPTQLRRVKEHTGITPNFTLHQETIQNGYTLLVENYFTQLAENRYRDFDMGVVKKAVDSLRETTDIAPQFNGKIIEDLYEKIIGQWQSGRSIGGTLTTCVKDLHQITGLTPTFSEDKLRNLYGLFLYNYNPESTRKRIEELEAATATKRAFTSEAVYRYSLEILTGTHTKELLENKVDKLKQLFGIIPEFKDEDIQKLFNACIQKDSLIPSIVQDIETIKKLTRREPKLGGDKVQPIFNTLLKCATEHYGIEMIQNLQKATGIKPVFDEQKVQESFVHIPFRDPEEWIKRVNMLGELAGIKPDFQDPALENQVRSIYNTILEKHIFDTQTLKDRLKVLEKFTAVSPLFYEGAVYKIYEKMATTVDITHVLTSIYVVEALTNIPISREAVDIFMKRVIDHISQYVGQNPDRLFFEAYGLYERMGIQNDCLKTILPKILESIPSNPKSIIEKRKMLLSLPLPPNELNGIQEFFNTNPWCVAMKRLQHIQAPSANEENDPWKNELEPLIKKAIEQTTISLENPKDANLLVEFISEVGMVNLPKFFAVYADCKRAKSFEDISSDTRTTLESFGIQLQRNDGSWRFQNSLQLIAEINKRRNRFQKELLADTIPAGLETSLGEEMFARLKGTTKWERGTSLASMLSVWKTTQEKQPELSKLPVYFMEKQFEVPLLVQKTESSEVPEKETQEKIKQFLASQEVEDTYRPLAQSLSRALRTEAMRWWQETQRDTLGSLNKDIQEMKELLATAPQALDELIAKEQNEKQRAIVDKKIKALKNPKAREGFTNQLKALEATREHITSLILTEEQTSRESAIVSLMESLRELGNKLPDAGMLLRQLSAFHILEILEQGWKTQLREQLYQEYVPNEERIEALTNFSRQYIYEHYLHESQEQAHTNHTPFSANLFRELKAVWQQQAGSRGFLPIERTYKNLQAIVKPANNQENADNTSKVSMVPVAGLFRIFSGDIGESCYTSRHLELAQGEYPRLKAWIYATNRGKPNETLRGSVLTIETHRDDGVPTLLVRANNPRENFIQSINADVFTIESLRQAIETARSVREARIKNNNEISSIEKRQCVVFPLDRASQSSTNRTQVAAAYKKYFEKEPKVALTNEPETNFNGYTVWRKNSTHACVVIWEMDENGQEVYHGNWKKSES